MALFSGMMFDVEKWKKDSKVIEQNKQGFGQPQIELEDFYASCNKWPAKHTILVNKATFILIIPRRQIQTQIGMSEKATMKVPVTKQMIGYW